MDQVARAIEEATGAGNSELARAKINLALHVGAERPDGYHDLESLVVFADIADAVTVRPAPKAATATTLELTGPHAALLEASTAPASNLVLRAAEAVAALGSRRRTRPVHLSLAKRIPIAAGLGGGSADAAATLRLLDRLWGLGLKPKKLAEIALSLGADVPMCLVSKPLVATGIGDSIRDPPKMPSLPIVLAHPGVPVSTADVFRQLPAAERTGLPPMPGDFPTLLDVIFWLRQARNDLAEPAAAVNKAAVAAAKALMRDPDCLFARMSGSGAAAFGIFINMIAAERAAERLREAKPGWWVVAARTLAS